MSERFDIIKPYLDYYKRPFSVLDFGCGINYPTIGEEIAEAYPEATVVCVEKDLDVTKLHKNDGVIWIKGNLDEKTLFDLSNCESFDVIVAFNVLHWFENEFHMITALNSLYNMCERLFVQVPEYRDEESKAPGYANLEAIHTQIGIIGGLVLEFTSQFPGHPPRPLYIARNNYRGITQTSLAAHQESAKIKIYSTPYDCRYVNLKKLEKAELKPFVAGMNLANFLLLNGVRPTVASLINDLKALKGQVRTLGAPHGDINLHNFIMSSRKLTLIDGFDGWGNNDDIAAIDRLISKLEGQL